MPPGPQGGERCPETCRTARTMAGSSRRPDAGWIVGRRAGGGRGMADATTPRGGGIDEGLNRASTVPLWPDTPERPDPRPSLDGDIETHLVIVGGGFTGLWTALRAKERRPDRRVLLLESGRLAEQATGRNRSLPSSWRRSVGRAGTASPTPATS